MRHITIGDLSFQGDLAIIGQAPSLPASAVAAPDNIAAHSETGHHHVVLGGRLFRDPLEPLGLYVVVERSEVSLRHLRDFNTHEEIVIGGCQVGDVIVLGRQREASETAPEGWRVAAD